MKDLLRKYNLPKRVEVVLNKTKEGGFVVEFPNLPGCFTQAEDLSKLDEQVTDVILTYFDVPRTKAGTVIYIPEAKHVAPVSTKKLSGTLLTPTRFDLFVAA